MRALYTERDFLWYEVLSPSMLGIVWLAFPARQDYSIDEFSICTE